MYLIAPITTRNQFGTLLAARGLLGCAVEVGTHRGEFARVFLDSWPGKKLVCVDPWSVPPGYEDQAETLRSIGGKGDREADYQATVKALRPHVSRVVLMRCLSAEAAESFADGSLDFVYLDADHARPAIDHDLVRWWSKLRPGGLLAGHDWMCPGEIKGGWAQLTQPAVYEFSRPRGLTVHVVRESGLPWSFYLEKPCSPP